MYAVSDDATNPNQYNNQDTIYGGEGSDIIYGGKGNDTIYTNTTIGNIDTETSATTNTVYGGDTIFGSNDMLHK